MYKEEIKKKKDELIYLTIERHFHEQQVQNAVEAIDNIMSEINQLKSEEKRG